MFFVSVGICLMSVTVGRGNATVGMVDSAVGPTGEGGSKSAAVPNTQSLSESWSADRALARDNKEKMAS